MNYSVRIPYTDSDIRAMGHEIESAQNALKLIKSNIADAIKDELPGLSVEEFIEQFDDLKAEIKTAEDNVEDIRRINQAEIDRKGFDVTITLNIEDTINEIATTYQKALDTQAEERFRND